jgi:hypothetical protein
MMWFVLFCFVLFIRQLSLLSDLVLANYEFNFKR